MTRPERKGSFNSELEEFRLEAYESARLYKETTKFYHDKSLRRKEFHPGMIVLLFESRLKLFRGKLKSTWMGPYGIVKVFTHGVIEIESLKKGERFNVNGH